MRRPFAQFRTKNARALGQYWDEIVTHAPATPIPNPDARAELGATIRLIHSQDEQGQGRAPYADRQLRMLLARHKEISSMPQGTFAQSPVLPIRARSGRVPMQRPIAIAPISRRWAHAVSAFAVIGLIVVASLASYRVMDRPSPPNEFPGINAAITSTPDATPGPAVGKPTLLWAASTIESQRTFALSVPVDIAVLQVDDTFETLYVLDAESNSVEVFAADGTSLGAFSSPNGQVGSGNDAFSLHALGYYSGGIDFDAEGNMYIFDSFNNRVQKFDSEGTAVTQWRARCKLGDLRGGSGGTVDPVNGRVYVADNRYDCIQVFDLNGKHLDQWGSWGVGNGQFISPDSIAVAPDGTIFVGELSSGRIQHFDQDGKWLGAFGYPATDLSGDGSTARTNGLAIDANGNLVVVGFEYGETNDGSVDYGSWQGTIWVYAPDGTELARYTEVEGFGPLGNLSGVAVSPDGSIYLTTSPWPADQQQVTTTSGDLIHIALPSLTGR